MPTATAAAMTPAELVRWITDHGYTQETLSQALHLNRTSLYKWLNDRHPITPIVKLALDHLAATQPEHDPEDLPVSDGDSLIAWMTENAFDDAMLADVFGVHTLSVARWRSGRHPITWPMRLAFARLGSDRRALAARRALMETQAKVKEDAERRVGTARQRARDATMSH